MVDVGPKRETARIARAEAIVRLGAATLKAVLAGAMQKGDVFAVARIAGIQAAKDTPRLIPLCHPLRLSSVVVDIEAEGKDALRIETEVRCAGQTGVEMEAMTAA